MNWARQVLHKVHLAQLVGCLWPYGSHRPDQGLLVVGQERQHRQIVDQVTTSGQPIGQMCLVCLVDEHPTDGCPAEHFPQHIELRTRSIWRQPIGHQDQAVVLMRCFGDPLATMWPRACNQGQKQAIEPPNCGVIDRDALSVQQSPNLGELLVFALVLDANEGNHIQTIGAVRWTDLQVSTSVKVRPVLIALGILADSAVGYDIELSSERLHRLVRMCGAAH